MTYHSAPHVDSMTKPRLLITMGDVAGIGPEIIARAWANLLPLCRPVVVGDPDWLRKALDLDRAAATVQVIQRFDDAETSAAVVPCLRGSDQNLTQVVSGRVSAAAGKAAYDFLCT